MLRRWQRSQTACCATSGVQQGTAPCLRPGTCTWTLTRRVAPPWQRRRAFVPGAIPSFSPNQVTLQIVATALFGSDMDGTRARTITESIAIAFDFFGRRSSTGFIVPEWVSCSRRLSSPQLTSGRPEVPFMCNGCPPAPRRCLAAAHPGQPPVLERRETARRGGLWAHSRETKGARGPWGEDSARGRGGIRWLQAPGCVPPAGGGLSWTPAAAGALALHADRTLCSRRSARQAHPVQGRGGAGHGGPPASGRANDPAGESATCLGGFLASL